MPRTKGTAALCAAKRSLKINEPIEVSNIGNKNDLSKVTSLFEIRARNQSYSDWNALQNTMSDINTATKIFGSGLQQFYPARKWFLDIANENRHDLYILIRNPKQILWSFLIALHDGFGLATETGKKHIEISDADLYKADLVLDNFLRFYPTNGELVTFETLPLKNFDYTSITMGEQKSMSKIQYVSNRDYVNKSLDLILQFYQKEWEDKTKLDIFSDTY